MPTQSETTGRATSAADDPTDSLDSVYDSLRSGAGEEAIAATIQAFTDLVRATVPVAVSQPARFLDLSFEVAQQAVSFQRRVLFEVLYGLQRVLAEAWSDLQSDQSLKGQRTRGSDQRARTTRRAA